MTNQPSGPPLAGRVALVAGATRGAGRAIDTHLITSAKALPLMLRHDGGLVGEMTDGTSEYNKNYRQTFYYDLVKAAVGRITLVLAAELAGQGCTALAVTPGWLRSEGMLENYGVTEQNWRDALPNEPHFCISESPAYVGRGIAALAADPGAARYAGKVLSSGELARTYGLTDTDGTRPDCWRYVGRHPGRGQARDRGRIPLAAPGHGPRHQDRIEVLLDARHQGAMRRDGPRQAGALSCGQEDPRDLPGGRIAGKLSRVDGVLGQPREVILDHLPARRQELAHRLVLQVQREGGELTGGVRGRVEVLESPQGRGPQPPQRRAVVLGGHRQARPDRRHPAAVQGQQELALRPEPLDQRGRRHPGPRRGPLQPERRGADLEQQVLGGGKQFLVSDHTGPRHPQSEPRLPVNRAGSRLGQPEMPLEAVLVGLAEGQARHDIECRVILDHSRRRPVERAWETLRLATRYAEQGVVGLGLAAREPLGSLFVITAASARR